MKSFCTAISRPSWRRSSLVELGLNQTLYRWGPMSWAIASVNRESCGSISWAQVLLTRVSFRVPNARWQGLDRTAARAMLNVQHRGAHHAQTDARTRVVESPVKQSLLLRKAGNSSQQGEPHALRDTAGGFVASKCALVRARRPRR